MLYAGRQGARVWLTRYSPPADDPAQGPKVPILGPPRGRGATGAVYAPVGTTDGSKQAKSRYPHFGHFYPKKASMGPRPPEPLFFVKIGAEGPMGGKILTPRAQNPDVAPPPVVLPQKWPFWHFGRKDEGDFGQNTRKMVIFDPRGGGGPPPPKSVLF